MKPLIESLVICYSESGLNYDAIHQGKYKGICGVVPEYWEDYLNELGLDYNSVAGGYAVYQYYLDKTGKNSSALKEFKGIDSKKKTWIINKVKKVIEEVKKINNVR